MTKIFLNYTFVKYSIENYFSIESYCIFKGIK